MNFLEAFLSERGVTGVRAWVESGRAKYLSSGPSPTLSTAQASAISGLEREIAALVAAHKPEVTPLPKGERSVGAFPLLREQERIYGYMQAGAFTHMSLLPLYVRLRAPLNRAALAQAFTEICRRHSILYARILHQDDGLVQFIDESRTFRLVEMDLTGVAADTREDEARRTATDFVFAPIDVANDFMLRVCTIKVGENDHIIVAAIPHIISDGISVEILGRELRGLYGAFTQGKPSPLPEPPLQFANYCQWHHESFDAFVAKSGPYWQRELAGTTVPVIPRDPDVTEFEDLAYGFRSLICMGDLLDDIKQFCRKSRATLFMTTYAAITVILHRWTRGDDILVDLAVSSRMLPESADLIGLISRMILIRTNMRDDPTFQELIARVKKPLFETLSHMDMTVSQVKELVGLEYEDPIVISHGVVGAPKQAGESAQDIFEPFTTGDREGRSPYFVSYLIVEQPDRLHINMYYRKRFFRMDTIDLQLRKLERALRAVIENPDIRLSALIDAVDRQA